MDVALINGRVMTDRGLEAVAVRLSGHRIAAIGRAEDLKPGAEVRDLGGAMLLPGFIDTQVNGGDGLLFNEAPTVETIARIGAAHRKFGTTGFLPTLISDDLSTVEAAIGAARQALAEGVPGVLGIHIEGPFLNARRKGIHDASKFRRTDETSFKLLTSLGVGRTLVTLAPEATSPEMIQQLVKAGVIVSAGHTNASYATVRAALAHGLSGFTHLFNAMSPLTSREPGVVGAALEDTQAWCGIIVDGVHVDPVVLKLALRLRPHDRFNLITDAMPSVGTDLSAFSLQGRTIKVRGGACYDEGGTLAGSALDMASAVGNAVKMLDLDLAEAARMASRNPATFLGLDHERGRIAVGCAADLVLLGDDLTVLATWIAGRPSAEAPSQATVPRTLLALVLAIAALAGAAHAQTIDIVPRPQSVTTGSGALVVVGPRTPIVTPSGDKAAARYLASLLQTTRGLALSVRSPATAHGAAIVFAHSDDSSLGREGYRLTIGDRRVRIEATTNAGLFYGAVSLWQLITAQSGQRGATLQPMTITDSPRFAWRGLLLDSARHYQSPAFIRRMIDWMALHKLNTLQWHLTDDQAWRLQIRKYPRLTSIGAWRTAPDRKTGKPVQYGGFYTQAEVRNLVAYAAARHVTIVPEIEMPGHSLSAIVAYPWLGVAKPDPATRGDWGIFPDILSPSERTYGFMTDVLSEVMALFPGPWINVGGDEAVKDEWRASPTVQAQIKTLGLANEDALQGWFTARIGGFIAAHGRRMIGWDDILVGGAGLPADAATVSWHADGAARATTAGHDTVIATDPILYFDHRQADLASEPTGRSSVVSLQDVYQSEPVPAAFAPADAAHIIGVQANLWTEHMRTQADVMQMAFPRAAAIAEVAWTQPARKDWPDFEERLPAEFTRYRGLGLAPDMGAVSVKLDAQRQGGGLEVTLSKQLQLGDIRYTLDGAVPTAASQAYAQPLTITSPAHLQAATFVDGHRVSPVLDRKIDPAAPERRLSQELTLCSQKVALNLDSVSDAQHGPYLVDIMNPCWTWPQADLTQARKIEVAVTRLPFNFQLGADAAKIVLRPPATPAGELEVRADGCTGTPIATLPLAAALSSNGDTVLAATLPPLPGRHDLCLSFTQRKLDPMWVVGWVSLR